MPRHIHSGLFSFPTTSQLDANQLYNTLLDLANEITRSKQIFQAYGPVLPSTTDTTIPAPIKGDLFYLTTGGEPGLYCFTGTTWIEVNTFDTGVGPTLPADSASTIGDIYYLTQQQNSFEPGLYMFGPSGWFEVNKFDSGVGPTLPADSASNIGDIFYLTQQQGSFEPGLYMFGPSGWFEVNKFDSGVGASLPADADSNIGDIFYLTSSSEPGLYMFGSSGWFEVNKFDSGIGNAFPSGANTGDIYYLTQNYPSYKIGLYIYDGANWIEVNKFESGYGNSLPTADMVAGDIYYLADENGHNEGVGLYIYSGSAWVPVAPFDSGYGNTLPTTGMSVGDIYYLKSAEALYMFNGSTWENTSKLDIGIGGTFPPAPTAGDLFLYNVLPDYGLYIFDGTNWIKTTAFDCSFGSSFPTGNKNTLNDLFCLTSDIVTNGNLDYRAGFYLYDGAGWAYAQRQITKDDVIAALGYTPFSDQGGNIYGDVNMQSKKITNMVMETYVTTNVSDTAVTNAKYVKQEDAATLVSAKAYTDTRETDIKEYVDVSDYLNNNPKLGVLSTSPYMPVYSDYKFSSGTWGGSSFSFIDNQSRQMLYFHAENILGVTSVYRAYRFSDESGSFIYENEPAYVKDSNGNKLQIRWLINAGTNFMTVVTGDGYGGYWNLPNNKTYIVKTNGSSNYSDWTIAYDVSNYRTEANHANFALYQIKKTDGTYADAIIRISLDTSAKNVICTVMDSGYLVKSQFNLFTGSTNVAASELPAVNVDQFLMYGNVRGFTWHQQTKKIFYSIGCETDKINNAFLRYSISLCHQLDLAPAFNGTNGAITSSNLIPVKQSGYRYEIEAATLKTTFAQDDGVIPWYEEFFNVALTTDDYSGAIYATRTHPYTGDRAGMINKIKSSAVANFKMLNLRTDVYSSIYQYPQSDNFIPDSSLYSKQIWANFAAIYDNNVLVLNGYSRSAGDKIVKAQLTGTLSTVANAFDTLDVSVSSIGELTFPTAMTARIDRAAFPEVSNGKRIGAGCFFTTKVPNSSTVISGWGCPGSNLHVYNTTTSVWEEASINSSPISIPELPASIGSFSNLVFAGIFAIGNSLVSPAMYFGVFANGKNTVRIVKYINGTWSIDPTNECFLAGYNSSVSARGGIEQNYKNVLTSTGSTLLTASGYLIFSGTWQGFASQNWLTCIYNVISDSVYYDGDASKFIRSSNNDSGVKYPMSNNYGHQSFGYNNSFGYFALNTSGNYKALTVVSSKDYGGTSPELTEMQWIDSTPSGTRRYEKFFPVAAATGLVAYVLPYPVFIGGYFFPTFTQAAVPLQPNTDNYIYLERVGSTTSKRGDVVVTRKDEELPNSAARILIARITTNAENVTASKPYPADGIGLPLQKGKAGKTLMTDGEIPYWGLPAEQQITSVDANQVGTPAGTICWWPSTTIPSGWLPCEGQSLSTITYPELYAAVGTTWGGVPGVINGVLTNIIFNLPDLRGNFIRGWDNNRNLDTNRVFGSYQADSFASHSHSYTINLQGEEGSNHPAGGNAGPDGTFTSSTDSTGGTETRPKNIALRGIIKYTSAVGQTMAVLNQTLPTQQGNAGRILMTDGTSASWVDEYPTKGVLDGGKALVVNQAGNGVEWKMLVPPVGTSTNGKILSNDGTSTSWIDKASGTITDANTLNGQQASYYATAAALEQASLDSIGHAIVESVSMVHHVTYPMIAYRYNGAPYNSPTYTGYTFFNGTTSSAAAVGSTTLGPFYNHHASKTLVLKCMYSVDCLTDDSSNITIKLFTGSTESKTEFTEQTGNAFSSNVPPNTGLYSNAGGSFPIPPGKMGWIRLDGTLGSGSGGDRIEAIFFKALFKEWIN